MAAGKNEFAGIEAKTRKKSGDCPLLNRGQGGGGRNDIEIPGTKGRRARKGTFVMVVPESLNQPERNNARVSDSRGSS